MMRHRINPIVDCVFKALLGSEKNKNLLIHFLNAVTELQGDEAITDVVIMNPYNEREFIDGKLSVVDIKAKCQNDFKYQVEIQLAVYSALSSRIVYNWSTIYHSQLTKQKGDYKELKPVFSIWILENPLFKDVENYHLKFGLNDLKNNISLSDHLTIHLLQLSHFDDSKAICNETERWLYFFKKAENQEMENLPEVLKTKEMKQAMETLQDFSENQKNYLLYQSRLDAQYELNTLERLRRETEIELAIVRQEKEKERSEKERERSEKERALKEKEEALREKEIYLKILKEKGIDIGTITLASETV